MKRIIGANEILLRLNHSLFSFFKKGIYKKHKRINEIERNSLIIIRFDDILDKKRLFLRNDLVIEMLAREVGTNRTYLSRAIHLQKGVSFSDYVNSRRICYAKECIQTYITNAIDGKSDPDLTTEDLALLSGFGSKRNFIRYFKKIEGITPGQYMKGLMVRLK